MGAEILNINLTCYPPKLMRIFKLGYKINLLR